MDSFKRKIIISFLTLMALFPSWSFADTHAAASCSFADVNAAVSAALSGDTVTVPACTSTTWASRLTITKGITLQGAGIGNTTIASSQGTGTVMVQYTPATPANDTLFRVTGFTFDGNGGNSIGVQVTNSGDTYPLHNIRIDHNRFYHCTTGVVFGNWNGGSNGRISGVVDSNTFDDCKTFTRAYGSYEVSWNNDPLDLGGPTGMYVESNTLTMSSAWCSANAAALHHASSGWGGRYTYRFNTITYNNGGWQDGFDIHGKQACDSSNSGSVSSEIYKNTITYGVGGGRFVAGRGGQERIYNNTLTNTSNIQITDENYSRPGMQCCTSWPCPQMVHVYFWSNINNGSDIASVGFFYNDVEPKDSTILHEDRDYFLPKGGAFNGSTGVGVGTRAQMNAITPTVNNVGFWVTDEGSWNTSGSGGQGRLYTARGGAWVLSYTPYTYPHPLTKNFLMNPLPKNPYPPIGITVK